MKKKFKKSIIETLSIDTPTSPTVGVDFDVGRQTGAPFVARAVIARAAVRGDLAGPADCAMLCDCIVDEAQNGRGQQIERSGPAHPIKRQDNR